MNKEIYLIRGKENENYADFKNRIFETVTGVIKELKPVSIKFTLTEIPPPAISVIPFGKSRIAAISLISDDGSPVQDLIQAEGFYGGYRVTEALPVSYPKTWKDGVRTPGACLLTLFSRKKNLDYDKFIDRWHNGHTPLSLRFHPLWNYVRNVVNEKLTDNSPWFDGIVEEQVKESKDLLNPFRFFGNPLIIIPRMIKVYTDTKSFIDYPGMETYLAAEYHIKSK